MTISGAVTCARCGRTIGCTVETIPEAAELPLVMAGALYSLGEALLWKALEDAPPGHLDRCDRSHTVRVVRPEVRLRPVETLEGAKLWTRADGFALDCCGCGPLLGRLDPGEARKRRRLLVGARPVKTRRPPVTPARHVTVQVEPGPWLPWPYAGEATPTQIRELADQRAEWREREQPKPGSGG